MNLQSVLSRIVQKPLVTGLFVAAFPFSAVQAFDIPNPFKNMNPFGGPPANDPCEVQYLKVQQYEERMVSLVDPNLMSAGLDCLFQSGSAKSQCLERLGRSSIQRAQQNYLMQKKQQASNRAQLLAAVDQDAYQQARYLRGLNSDISQLRQCRQTTLRSINSRQRARQLDRADADRERADLKKLIERDQKLIEGITGQTAINTNVLVESSSELGVYQSSNTSSAAVVGTKKCVSKTVNVRNVPTTANNSPIGKLHAGQCIPIRASVKNGSWYEVDYFGASAYMASSVFRSAGKSRGGSSGSSNVAKAEKGQEQLEQEQESFAALMKEIDDSSDYLLESDV